MCKCTPNIRTPFCGKPGCEWPEQRSSKEWLPFDEAVALLRSRLMTTDPSYVLEHWDCKYVNVRVDMRTGNMLIAPGTAQRAVEPTPTRPEFLGKNTGRRDVATREWNQMCRAAVGKTEGQAK